MKSQILYVIGNLKYAEVDTPSPKDGEALIKVNACGICGSDIPHIFKTGAHNMPHCSFPQRCRIYRYLLYREQGYPKENAP